MASELVSVVALAGWLILALSAYRSRKLSGKTTLMHILLWVTIFLVVALAFRAIGAGIAVVSRVPI